MSINVAASVMARLLAGAKRRGEDFNLTLTRYAMERFLYRLSISEARERYWLKGALLFRLWFDVPHRPTRDMDIDFLGIGPDDPAHHRAVMEGICGIDGSDGMHFDPGSVTVQEIREKARYGGIRIKLLGHLGQARCVLQLDIGFGDAVTPGPDEIVYPTLIDDQLAPHLKAYPRAAVIAEKLEAIVDLGMTNSRMKDYFDLRGLAREAVVDPPQLASAIAATFERRGPPLPDGIPSGLTKEFATDPTKRT